MTAADGPIRNAGDHPVAVPMLGREQDEFAMALREVENAARDWGVRSDLPEGRFVTALMVAIRLTGRVSETARDEFRRLFDENRKTAALELQHAHELTKAADISLRRAQVAEIGLMCEQQNVAQHMIDKTLPIVADRLKTLLVIRERAWNRKTTAKHYAIAGAIALGIFVGGYTLRDWSEDTPRQEVERCFTHPVQADGRTYCDFDVMLGTGR